MLKNFLSRMLALPSLLLMSVHTGACGTQTGNPPTQTHTTKLFDESVSSGLINGIYSELVDNINLGEYAYSSGESRVINRLSCQALKDTGLSLQKETATQHSVGGRIGEQVYTADLNISRQYIDTWYQSGQLVPCEPESGRLGINLQSGQDLMLSSQVDETRQRDLQLVDESGAAIAQDFVEIQKRGNRVSRFVVVSAGEEQLEIAAEVEEQAMVRRISLLDDGGENLTYELSSLSGPEAGLGFEVNLEAGTRQVRSYFIKSASLRYDLGEDQEIMVEFQDLRIETGRQCFPSEGRMSGYLRQGGTKETFTLDLAEERTDWTFRTDQGREIRFAPQACVLNER